MDTRKNKTKSQANSPLTNHQIYELVNIFEPTAWKLDEIVNPWRASEEKFYNFKEVFKFKVDINDFRDYVNISLNKSNHEVPETIKKVKTPYQFYGSGTCIFAASLLNLSLPDPLGIPVSIRSMRSSSIFFQSGLMKVGVGSIFLVSIPNRPRYSIALINIGFGVLGLVA
jgi:hypothetical protein